MGKLAIAAHNGEIDMRAHNAEGIMLPAIGSRFRRRSSIPILSAITLAIAVLVVSPIALAQDRQGDIQWVGTWATSPTATNAVSFSNQILRMIVRVSVGGQTVRVRFSNAYGTKPLVIGAAHIALRAPCTVQLVPYTYNPPPPPGTCSTAAGAAIVSGSDRVLTFGGSPSTKIWTGALAVSDPVELDVPARADLAVSFYLPGDVPGTLQITRHGTAKQTSYISPPGDYTASTVMPVSAATLSWYFVNTVEVMASEQTGAIVAFGDSLTDANVSTPDTNSRWPYELARRLIAQPGNHKMGVLDHGTGGDRVLWDSTAAVVGANDAGLHRFDRDVIAQTGVTHVIVLLGINDLRNQDPALYVTADDMISGYKQMIERAHARGIKIFGGTLIPWWQATFTPGEWALWKWEIREQVNAWIRTSGAFDAVIDFDKCLADPNDPKNMLAIYDSADHLHPNDFGYIHMGDCIDLSLFKNGEGH